MFCSYLGKIGTGYRFKLCVRLPFPPSPLFGTPRRILKQSLQGMPWLASWSTIRATIAVEIIGTYMWKRSARAHPRNKIITEHETFTVTVQEDSY
jgi:hypothetical protein